MHRLTENTRKALRIHASHMQVRTKTVLRLFVHTAASISTFSSTRVLAENHHPGGTTDDDEAGEGSMTWKDNQPGNLETEGPQGRIKAAAKSLLNFVNQTFVSAGKTQSWWLLLPLGRVPRADVLRGVWASVSWIKIIISVTMSNLTAVPNAHPQTTPGFPWKDTLTYITASVFLWSWQKNGMNAKMSPNLPSRNCRLVSLAFSSVET